VASLSFVILSLSLDRRHSGAMRSIESGMTVVVT
jgi:hypothetical protein